MRLVCASAEQPGDRGSPCRRCRDRRACRQLDAPRAASSGEPRDPRGRCRLMQRLRARDPRAQQRLLRYRAVRAEIRGVTALPMFCSSRGRCRRTCARFAAHTTLHPTKMGGGGRCAANGRIFAASYAEGGVKRGAGRLHIPGCPPTPTALLKGLIALVESA